MSSDPDPLLTARATLCDLLIGRMCRARAADELETALRIEERSPALRVLIDQILDRAAHMEWVAGISERGEVMWGGRLNRCGRAPEDG